MLIVGIDWARYKHDAVLLNSTGKLLERITFPHTADGFGALADTVAIPRV